MRIGPNTETETVIGSSCCDSSSTSTSTTKSSAFVTRIHGSLTQVPDNPYSRLSYYLKCVTVGCGIRFVFDPVFLDYLAAERHLSEVQKVHLHQLCGDLFRPHHILEQVMFVDANNSVLPLKIANHFYQLEYEQLPPTPPSVQEILVCTPEWLRVFYTDPMRVLREGGSFDGTPSGCGVVCDPSASSPLLAALVSPLSATSAQCCSNGK